MTAQLPVSLFAAPPRAEPAVWVRDARLFDGTQAPVREGAAVLVRDGRIDRVANTSQAPPDDAVVIDVGGRTVMPGLVNAHVHLIGEPPDLGFGAQPVLPGTAAQMLGATLREFLRYGVTTVRDMGSYGDQVMENRQAMRYGAYRGPRVLTCGRIISSTSPGDLVFDGMYRRVDGPDEARKGVREELARGADFVKVMTTGARSVELEAGVHRDAEQSAHALPVQLTLAEFEAVADEAHRLGYRVAAHAEGNAGCEVAVELGMRTIEHGFYLHRRPDLLERMAAEDIALVPTLSSQYVFAGRDLQVGTEGPTERFSTHELDAVAGRNIEEAALTLRAAYAAGTPVVLGGDDLELRRGGVWIEVLRMLHHGLPAQEALVAATSAAAHALGLDEIGVVAPGRLADLLVLDGDPVAEPALLGDPDRFWLVFRDGSPVAGTALETSLFDLARAT